VIYWAYIVMQANTSKIHIVFFFKTDSNGPYDKKNGGSVFSLWQVVNSCIHEIGPLKIICQQDTNTPSLFLRGKYILTLDNDEKNNNHLP
jgi:hypothetical protein